LSKGLRFAFEVGADMTCACVCDFQMVDDVNIALNLLKQQGFPEAGTALAPGLFLRPPCQTSLFRVKFVF